MSTEQHEPSPGPEGEGPSLGMGSLSEQMVRLDLRLLPGTSLRRREYPPTTSLWQIKEDCEAELLHPLLVVAVVPPAYTDQYHRDKARRPSDGPAAEPRAALPWHTQLQQLGFAGEGSSNTLDVYVLRKNEWAQGERPRLEDCQNAQCLTDAAAGIELALRPRQHASCQTSVLDTRSSQNAIENSAQCEKKGLFLACQDKYLTPGVYETADEWERRVLDKAITIQKYARRWQARRQAQRMRQERLAAEERERALQQELQRKREIRSKRQMERGEHPLTQADFARLFAEVAAWQAAETRRIKALGLQPQQRRAALSQLLQQETQLLQRLERLKAEAAATTKRLQQQLLLRKMEAPLVWVQSDGGVATVYTPHTCRAGQLKQLHTELLRDSADPEERVRILKETLKAIGTFRSPVAAELTDLLEREVKLLARGRTATHALGGLRLRISNEFFRLILDPEFNPQARLVTKVATI